MRENQQGISNRETAAEEAEERQEFPQVTPDAPPVEQDAAGSVGEQGGADDGNLQTSHKSGSHSTAQKQSTARYAEGAPPSTHKVAGASGRENPQDFGRPEDTNTPRPEASGE